MIDIYSLSLEDLSKPQLIVLVQFLLNNTPLADDQENVNQAVNDDDELREFLDG